MIGPSLQIYIVRTLFGARRHYVDCPPQWYVTTWTAVFTTWTAIYTTWTAVYSDSYILKYIYIRKNHYFLPKSGKSNYGGKRFLKYKSRNHRHNKMEIFIVNTKIIMNYTDSNWFQYYLHVQWSLSFSNEGLF